jgi:hypothetical protein
MIPLRDVVGRHGPFDCANFLQTNRTVLKYLLFHTPGATLQKNDIDGMSVNELWDLHLEISEFLRKRLSAELSAVEQRLCKLRAWSGTGRPSKQRLHRNGGAARVTAAKELATA